MAEALKSAKGDVKFTELTEEGHDLSRVYANAELWKWLLENRLHK